MYNGVSIIAIIPARAGSKGLVGKNLMKLHGLPLVAWSILAGIKSRYLDSVVVSTDSPEIMEIALRYGAESPTLRPESLATDSTPTYDVINHVLEYYRENFSKNYDLVILLEPTSPLRSHEDIDNAIVKLLSIDEANSLVGVGRCEAQHPDFMVTIGEDGFISGLESKRIVAKRRQEISPVYFLEGSIYISKVEKLKEWKSFYQDKTLALEFPKWKTFEIDDFTDFLIVEKLSENESRLN